MLECLSVKNFALIKEAHIDFKNNLNVLTGETGSGKSILIGSLNLALGMRASKDVMRNDDEDTIVSISFEVKDKFMTYVSPEYGKVDSFIQELTGITPQDTDGAPKIKEALNRYNAMRNVYYNQLTTIHKRELQNFINWQKANKKPN